MSRAFVTERGGDWGFCRKIRDTCSYADEYGKCMFSYCRVEREEQEKAKKETDNTDPD